LEIGGKYHPDDPYHNTKVRPIVNDARSFLRTTDQKYDMIVYGLLDSHTLLSHGSNVRLDSFVYTLQAFREARDRLADGGLLSLSFAILSPEQARKIYLMLEEAFDGVPPVVVKARLQGVVVFLERKSKEPITLPAELLASGDFEVTSEYANPEVKADISTDDWPFFYMPRRVYPMSYVIVLGLILLASVIMVVPFFKARHRTWPHVWQYVASHRHCDFRHPVHGVPGQPGCAALRATAACCAVHSAFGEFVDWRPADVPSGIPADRDRAADGDRRADVPIVLFGHGVLNPPAIERGCFGSDGRQFDWGDAGRTVGIQLDVFRLPVLVLDRDGDLRAGVPDVSSAAAWRQRVNWGRYQPAALFPNSTAKESCRN
jgi:hypothetical protein